MGLAFALATVGVARANDVQFSITNTSGVQIATFELPLNPTPTVEYTGYWFSILSVPVTVPGAGKTLANLTFLEDGSDGEFVGAGFNFSGPQFYSGPESSPTFLLRSYVLLDLNDVTHRITDTVTVKELTADPPPVVVPDPPLPDPPDPPAIAAPELSTWAMLLLGFLGLGYVSYRKTRTSVSN